MFVEARVLDQATATWLAERERESANSGESLAAVIQSLQILLDTRRKKNSKVPELGLSLSSSRWLSVNFKPAF